jgi:hypothetical protein
MNLNIVNAGGGLQLFRSVQERSVRASERVCISEKHIEEEQDDDDDDEDEEERGGGAGNCDVFVNYATGPGYACTFLCRT